MLEHSDAHWILELLREPFDPKAISWRIGATNGDKTAGIALAYLDARDVMKRLDEVLGIDGWQSHVTETVKGRVICELSIRIGGEWITRTDGAGDTDVEGEKGAISDALKRAAVSFGIGRYLYKLPNQWVKIQPAGRSYKLAEVPELPDWATPAGYWKMMERANPLVAHGIAVRENLDSIVAIKEAIASNELSTAAEAWFELDDATKQALWIAPTKGGIWTTQEREILHGNELRDLYYGDAA